MTSQIMVPRFTMLFHWKWNSEYHKDVIIESITMFSFQWYHFHFGALAEQENVNLFIDRTRLSSISISSLYEKYNKIFPNLPCKTSTLISNVTWMNFYQITWRNFDPITLSQTSPGFYVSTVQIFWKHWGKRRNCSYRAISPFPSVFSTCLENLLPSSAKLKLLSANSFSLEESKICRLGKG